MKRHVVKVVSVRKKSTTMTSEDVKLHSARTEHKKCVFVFLAFPA